MPAPIKAHWSRNIGVPVISFSHSRAILAVAFFVFTLAGCGGGGGISQQVQRSGLSQLNGGTAPNEAGLRATYPLSPSAANYSLPLPKGYDGAIAVGANHAPPDTRLQLNDVLVGLSDVIAATSLATTPASDPFPILIGLQVSSTVAVPVPGFTIHFPQGVSLIGKFNLAFFDPTKPVNPSLNPLPLGKTVGRRQSLTFSPPPDTLITFVGGVQYTFTISRDVGNAYPGAASSVILPVQSETLQSLADIGPLGADANYQVSSGTGFLQWQTISGSPLGIPPVIRGEKPIESLVASATQPLALNSVTVTGDFSNGGSLPGSSGSGGPGTFIPDPSPTVFGPFPATLTSKQATFTVAPPSGLHFGARRAWNFSLVTVTACVPQEVHEPCDSARNTNVLASVPTNTQFHVLVSDFSGLLNKSYSLTVAAPCSTAGINQDDNDGDNPPGYHDNPTGPNAEFTVLSGASPCTCTLTVSYNGSPVAQTTIEVGTSSRSTNSAIPYTLRPPVNGPRGYAVSGSIK